MPESRKKASASSKEGGVSQASGDEATLNLLKNFTFASHEAVLSDFGSTGLGAMDAGQTGGTIVGGAPGPVTPPGQRAVVPNILPLPLPPVINS